MIGVRARTTLIHAGVFPAIVVALATGARPAHADDMPGLWPATPGGHETQEPEVSPFKLNLYAQVEAGAFVAMTNASGFGGLGAKVTLTIEGVGAAIGGRWERDPRADGGLGFLEAQTRPFEIAEWKLYRWVDPYVAVGTELGGAESGFRATGYASAGLDVALWPSDAHPALSAQYFYRATQTPPEFAHHVLCLGLSMRGVF